MLDEGSSLENEKGTPCKASPLKISLPGEVDLMQEVPTTHSSVRCDIVGIACKAFKSNIAGKKEASPII